MSYRDTELSSPWCWEGGGWRLAEPTLALRKDRLLAIYDEYDLSFLEKEKEILTDTSIIWVKSNASITNAADLREFFRHFTRGQRFLGREGRTNFGGESFRVRFEVVVASHVFDRLRNSNLPNYFNPIMEAKRDLEGGYVCLGNFSEENALSKIMKRSLASRPSHGLAYAMVGGTNNSTLDDQDLFPHLWLDLVGKYVIPVNFEDRKKAFPKAFEQLGKRVEFYRRQLN